VKLFATSAAWRQLFILIPLVFLLGSIADFGRAQTTDAASTSRPAGEWNRFRLKDGEFSVLLPAPPALSSYKRESRLRPTDRHLHQNIGAYYDGAAYLVQVFETAQSLDEFIESLGVASKRQFKRSLKMPGVEGKEYAFEDTTFRSLTQVLVSKNRAYVFAASSSTLGNPDINLPKFFESISFEGSSEGNVIAEGPSEAQLIASPSVSTEAVSQPFSGREVTQKARVISKPQPTYTDAARASQTAGTVVLRGIFSASGEVVNIRVVSGLPDGLTERAIGAARQIKFIPPVKDGRFVSMWIQLEYNFNLY
jgi:TonB family protein